MTSETANIPIITGVSWSPLISCSDPKVNLGYAAGFSNPIVAINSPSSSEIMPFSGRPGAMNTAHVSPSNTSQKYSNELNRSAMSASAGAVVTSTVVPNNPPTTENTKPAPSTSSAWPFRVIAYASSQYAADAGVPGIRRSAPGMSPAKIAMAVAVTMQAIAGTGGMRKVTGTSSAVAMVAVNPGTAPTNSPNRADASTTPSTAGSNTIRNASMT